MPTDVAYAACGEMCFHVETHFSFINKNHRKKKKNKEDGNIFKELLTNTQIRVPEVRLIDENGSMIGIVPIAEAQRMADDKNLDLVLFSPAAKPPVCKLLNYSKYRYDQIRKDKEDKKKSSVIKVKEVQLSQTIDIGDIKVKAKRTIEFLQEGCKVKVVIRMRGRQKAHPEISMEVMNRFFDMVKESAMMEKEPKQESPAIIMMILAPAKK